MKTIISVPPASCPFCYSIDAPPIIWSTLIEYSLCLYYILAGIPDRSLGVVALLRIKRFSFWKSEVSTAALFKYNETIYSELCQITLRIKISESRECAEDYHQA